VHTLTAWVSNIKKLFETPAVRFMLQPMGSQQLDEIILRYRGQGHGESEDYFVFVAKLRQLRGDRFS
jgi:hypothetical protein